MMSDWCTAKLSDIIDFNPTLSLSKGKKATKIPMEYLQPLTKHISNTSLEAYNGGMKFQNGDTVMARITPCLENGKTAFVDMLDEDEVGFGSTEYIVWRAKAGITDPQFVYYLATSPRIRDVAIKSMVGSSGRQRVQQSVLDAYEIALPPLKEQIAIGRYLAMLDEKIVTNNRISDNISQQKKSVFLEMFKEGDHPEWPIVRLGDYLFLERGLSYKGKYLSETEGVPMVNLGNILPNSVFRPEKLKYYTGEFKSKATVRPGDIVVANTDLTQAREVLGSAIFIPDLGHETIICSHHISIVRDCKLSKHFILGLLNSQVYRERVIGFATGTTVLALPNETILNCEFTLPPMELIDEYDSIAENFYQESEQIRKENLRLATLRDLLLPKLMDGDIDIAGLAL